MAKKFRHLRNKMSPGSRERSKVLAAKYRDELALDELRLARNLTQQHLASLLKVKQAAISKIERRTDWYVSTLDSIIRAMGGTLEITAVFPDGKVRIKKFSDISKTAPAA